MKSPYVVYNFFNTQYIVLLLQTQKIDHTLFSLSPTTKKSKNIQQH
jgi:hypothetical protein